MLRCRAPTSPFCFTIPGGAVPPTFGNTELTVEQKETSRSLLKKKKGLVVVVWKGIHSRLDTNRTGAEGLFFTTPDCCTAWIRCWQ